MDLGTLASRNLDARQKITTYAGLLADTLLPDKSLVEALAGATNKDREVANLLQLEAIGNLLEGMNESAAILLEPPSNEWIAGQVIAGNPHLSKTAKETIEAWGKAK